MTALHSVGPIPQDARMILGLDDFILWQRAQRLSPTTVSERVRVIKQFHTDTGIRCPVCRGCVTVN